MKIAGHGINITLAIMTTYLDDDSGTVDISSEDAVDVNSGRKLLMATGAYFTTTSEIATTELNDPGQVAAFVDAINY